MTTVAIRIPDDVVAFIDELREREALSRAVWLGREIVLAVRACRLDEVDEGPIQ